MRYTFCMLVQCVCVRRCSTSPALSVSHTWCQLSQPETKSITMRRRWRRLAACLPNCCALLVGLLVVVGGHAQHHHHHYAFEYHGPQIPRRVTIRARRVPRVDIPIPMARYVPTPARLLGMSGRARFVPRMPDVTIEEPIVTYRVGEPGEPPQLAIPQRKRVICSQSLAILLGGGGGWLREEKPFS